MLTILKIVLHCCSVPEIGHGKTQQNAVERVGDEKEGFMMDGRSG